MAQELDPHRLPAVLIAAKERSHGRGLGRAWCLAAVALGLTLVSAASAQAQGILDSQARAMIRTRDLKKTKVSILVVDVTSGETLVSIRPDEKMIPASNMKLITTAGALDLLGPSFTFQTELRLMPRQDAGPPRQSSAGHVVLIVGDGDPALGDPKLLSRQELDIEQMLEKWVDALINAGVTEVERLVVDDRVFDRQWVHPDWPIDQLNRWYCAEVGGINLHENCLYVYPRPTTRGHSPALTFSPTNQYIVAQARNKATTDKTDTFWISRNHNTNNLTYWGKVRSRRTSPIRVTVHDPPMYLVQLLKERLEARGIAVQRAEKAGADERFPAGKTLVRWLNPLADVLARCNKDSQNLFAEALIKRMGYDVTGAQGSWGTGAHALRVFLGDRLGPDSAIVHISDGSGLSRKNQVTARVLVELLQVMIKDQPLGSIYLQSLAVGGIDGTLKKRFSRSLVGTVHGKSGYINGVSTLSGYLVYGGEPRPQRKANTTTRLHGYERVIAFSFLFNNIVAPIYVHNVKKFQNELIEIIDRQNVKQLESVRLEG